MRTLLALALLCSTAYGQIEVPAETEPYTPIVATVEMNIPEGADVKGGWSGSKGVGIRTPGNVPHAKTSFVWGPPGNHTLSFVGDWILLGELITVVDIHGKEHTFVPFLGRDDFDIHAVFAVSGGTDPDPFDPDPEPEPGHKYQIVFFIRAKENLSHLPPGQKDLVNSLIVRQELRARGHKFLLVVDDNQIKQGVPAKWKPYVDAVMGDSLPRVAIAPMDGGTVTDYPLPANYGELLQLLEGK